MSVNPLPSRSEHIAVTAFMESIRATTACPGFRLRWWRKAPISAPRDTMR
jgi:hypothetical protein